MNSKSITLSTMALLWASTAHADNFTDAVVDTYRNMGFDFVEVTSGMTQVKVEAIRGTEKVEVIYDRETGEILKQENERADADEVGLAGVEIDIESGDFLDDEDDFDDDEDDDEDDEDEDEDDDEDDEDEDDEDDDDDDDDDDDEDDEDGEDD